MNPNNTLIMKKYLALTAVIIIIIALIGGWFVFKQSLFNEKNIKILEGGYCASGGDCLKIDCSKYDRPGIKEGYKPNCVDNKCKCMCYGCE